MTSSSSLFKTRLVLSFFGFLDATYLTIVHFQNQIPPCTTDGCETVLTSVYAQIFGVPISLIGMLFYIFVFLLILNYKNNYVLILTSLGFVASLGLFVLQAFVINAFCTYCLVSGVITTLLFLSSLLVWRQTGNSI